MASFQEDAELEDKLRQDPRELSEDELQEIQIYKSHKLQARRDAGESGEKPDWWAADRAPQTMGDLAATVTGDGSEAAAEDTTAGSEEESTEEPEAEAAAPEEEVPEPGAPEAETPQAEAPEPEEPEPEPSAEDPEIEPAPPSVPDVPQVGWSKNVPKTEEIDFDSELMEGIYRRQDELMQHVQALRTQMGEFEGGGEALESVQGILGDLVESVRALQEDKSDADLKRKVDEIHDLLAQARDAEDKLSQLPPLPSEEELVAAGILDGPVEHDTSDNCFHTSLDNRKAALHYGPGTDRLVAYHYNLPTVFSQALRQTVEDVLARALFAYAEKENKPVHPQQARLRSGFLARHPEFREQTTEGRERDTR